MQQLKLENVILIWEAERNGRAFRTGLAVQEARFFFTKTQNIQLFSTHKKQPVKFLITEHIILKNQTCTRFLISGFLKAGLYCTVQSFFETNQSLGLAQYHISLGNLRVLLKRPYDMFTDG